MTEKSWSPARETKARCNGGCVLVRDYGNTYMVVDERRFDFLAVCPRCKGSGREPSPCSQKFPGSAA